MGRTNLRWEPTAAGKGGAECVAAARLMRAIQEVISWAVLQGEAAVCPQDHRGRCYHLSPPSASRGLHSSPAAQDSEPTKAREVLPLAEVVDPRLWFFSADKEANLGRQ